MSSHYHYSCPYCSEKVLSERFGRHLFRHHEETLFKDNSNRKLIHSDITSRRPLQLHVPKFNGWFCVGCYAFCKRDDLALKHVKKCSSLIQSNLKTLRETYPRDAAPELTTTVAESPLKTKELQQLFNSLAVLLGTIRTYEVKIKPEEPFEYDTLCSVIGKPLGKLGLLISEENLRESLPSFFPSEPEEEEVQEATPLPEVDDDVLPLYTEKPLTKLEVFNLLSEEDKRGLLDAYRPPAPPPPVPVQTLPLSTKNPYGNVITNTKRPPKQVPG